MSLYYVSIPLDDVSFSVERCASAKFSDICSRLDSGISHAALEDYRLDVGIQIKRIAANAPIDGYSVADLSSDDILAQIAAVFPWLKGKTI
jgi:hypothetical protein